MLGPRDFVHVGTYLYVQDFAAYLAAMREGATTTSWLVHNTFTAEPHDPAFRFQLYVAAGKLAAWAGASLLTAFAILENLGRIALSVSMYVFLAAFLPEASGRRLAFILAMFGGGFAVWEHAISSLLRVESALGLKASMEYVTFVALFLAPHLSLGYAAFLLAFVFFIAALAGSRRALVFLGAAVVALSLLNPFNLPVVLTTFGLFSVARWVLGSRRQVGTYSPLVVATICAAPILLIDFVTFRLDPFWNTAYSSPIVFHSSMPWELPVDFGIVFVLACLGLIATFRPHTAARVPGPIGQDVVTTGGTGSASRWLLIAFLASAFVWSMDPVFYQIRLLLGFQPALVVFAVIGWDAACHRLRRLIEGRGTSEARAAALARRLVTYPTVALASATAFTIFLSLLISLATDTPSAQYRIDPDTYAVGEWFSANTTSDDVVASAPIVGSVLAGMVNGRVVAGQPITLHFEEKSAMLISLYRGELSVDQARAFLSANRVSYVVVGPGERSIGPMDPGIALHLPVAVRIGNTVAYRVPPGALDAPTEATPARG
ncbi:MAG TPA: hypothetical protein VFC51_13665 [Chloroflexota bacterium]|nr:hypothetical protein [Chloroflexota bacterium]